MLKRLLLIVVIGALAVAGCGGDDDEGGATSATTTGGGSAPAAGNVVEIKAVNIKFSPEKAPVKVGQTVRWTNEDSVEHNVTAEEGADFKSDNLGQGEKFEFTPTKAGDIKYECTIHPGQTGELTVTG